MGHLAAPRTGDRGGGGIPALRPQPLQLTPGLAPFLAACGVGGWDASTGLADRQHPGNGVALFFLALLVTFGTAGFLLACVRTRTSRATPAGVLVLASTYVVPLLTGRAGAWSAGLVGAGLVGVAWLTEVDLRRYRRLPTQPLHWTWRAAVAVGGCAVVLDAAVIALGSASRPYHLSSPAVLVAGVSSTGLLALCALLAGGRSGPL